MSKPLPPHPPGVWRPARRFAEAVLRPLERFLHVQAASGIVLLVASVIALIWANSPWHDTYERLWHAPVVIGVGTFQSSQPLHFWINDGLMVIFFFVVGLEIRRELHHGELSDGKRAALPVAAAMGGMLVPAAIYFAVNHASPARDGWGVPMATDIAFAVGVLALLGKRVPAAMRVLLLALAIIDDIGAILVIAIFYSSGFSWGGIAVAALGVLGVLGLRSVGVRHPVAYVIPGIVIWGGFLLAGVHPTIAGVVLGLLTPARSWYGEEGFLTASEHALESFRRRASGDHDAHDLLAPLARLAEARREAVPPVVSLEAAMHPWVAYGIMPLFALANAGVHLGGVKLGESTSMGVMIGVVLGLLLGKPIGVLAASWVTVRLGLASLPRGVTWRSVGLVGVVAGIGFTMAIFIASLAFPDAESLGVAKLAVLVASAIAGVIALALGRVLLPAASPPDVASVTADDAEASTEL